MAYENTGYLAFANALNNAGQTFGNAIQERQRRQYLSDLNPFIQSGDMSGAAKVAFDMGDESLGIKFALLDQEKRKTAEQRAAGNEILAPFLGGGVGAGAAPAGVSGGVTPNPNPQPQPMNLPGGRYGVPQAYDLIKKVGGTDEEARMLAAIAQPESSGNPMAHNPKGADDSYGLWQINMRGALGPERMKQFGLSKPEDLYNPETNAKAALALARQRGGYGDWSTYKSGKYQAYLQNGKPGVQVADASGAVPASAMLQQPPQPQADSQVNALNSRIENLTKAIVTARAKGVDESTVKSLEMLHKQATDQLDNITKREQRVQDREEQRAFMDNQRKESAKDRAAASVDKNTESQAKNAIYYSENIANHEILNSPDALAGGTGTMGAVGRSLAAIPGAGPALTPEATGKFKQAADNFVSNVVYAKSGASATPAEYDRAYQNYIPTPFDKPELIAQKAKARQTWLDQMKVSSGNAAKSGSSSGSAAAPSSTQQLARPSSYDMQKAKEAIAAGRSPEEVTNFLRSRGMSTEGVF